MPLAFSWGIRTGNFIFYCFWMCKAFYIQFIVHKDCWASQDLTLSQQFLEISYLQSSCPVQKYVEPLFWKFLKYVLTICWKPFHSSIPFMNLFSSISLIQNFFRLYLCDVSKYLFCCFLWQQNLFMLGQVTVGNLATLGLWHLLRASHAHDSYCINQSGNLFRVHTEGENGIRIFWQVFLAKPHTRIFIFRKLQ